MLTSVFGYIKYGFGRVVNKCWLKILSLIGPNKAAVYYGWKFSRMCKNYDSSRKTVFTYTRPQFKRDIDELKKRTDFNFIVCDIEDLFNITDAFIPHTYGGQINFNSDNSTECKYYKDLLVQFFEKLYIKIQKKYKIDFIISANFDCSYDYGMAVAGKKHGIHSFVFYYEHPTIPYARVWWHSQYDYYDIKLYANKTAIWSNLVKDCLIDGKICSPSQIVMTGAPRFDRWRDLEENISLKKDITLMAYPGLEYFALCNFIDVIRVFAELSKKYPDHKFWVKTKNTGQSCLTNDYLDGIPDHNLKISHEFDLVDLQAHSKAVIGFNSLSILEAMLSNATLITPCWGDANLDPFLLQLDPNDELANKVYNLPKSKKEFENLLENIIETPEKKIFESNIKGRDYRDQLFERYFYRDKNIASSTLFKKMMISELEQNNKDDKILNCKDS